MRRNSTTLRAIVCWAGIIAAVTPAVCQRARPVVAKARRHRQEGTVQINDVTVSSYLKIEGSLTGSHVATGPDVTVDVADPKEPRSQSRVQAQVITIVP